MSDVQLWTYIVVAITFAFYIWIGYTNRVRDTKGFYVAGQGVPAVANGAATAADWMSAASFISMAGLISTMGFDGAIYLLGWTGGYVLLALLLAPYLRKFGYGRAMGVFLRSLVVDGLLVAHLWRRDRFRWAMHALMIYGFLALGLADILMSVFNPMRGSLPITHPLKLLPNLAGLAILIGIIYVRYRYSEDPYIDNGLTLSRDYAFLSLLTWTILTGFLVEGLGYAGAYVFIQPAYILHLLLVAGLFLTAPFTRFQHAFLVPVLMALTKVTSQVAYSGVELGFLNEPSPGRHHKSERIAEDVLRHVAPELAGKFRLRYYP